MYCQKKDKILVYTPAVVGYIGPVVVIIHGVDAQQRRVIDTSQAVRPFTNTGDHNFQGDIQLFTSNELTGSIAQIELCQSTPPWEEKLLFFVIYFWVMCTANDHNFDSGVLCCAESWNISPESCISHPAPVSVQDCPQGEWYLGRGKLSQYSLARMEYVQTLSKDLPCSYSPH